MWTWKSTQLVVIYLFGKHCWNAHVDLTSMITNNSWGFQGPFRGCWSTLVRCNPTMNSWYMFLLWRSRVKLQLPFRICKCTYWYDFHIYFRKWVLIWYTYLSVCSQETMDFFNDFPLLPQKQQFFHTKQQQQQVGCRLLASSWWWWPVFGGWNEQHGTPASAHRGLLPKNGSESLGRL